MLQERGIVIRSAGSWVDVRVGSTVVSSRIRGRMRLHHENQTQPVAVGDQVRIQVQKDGSGVITAIDERRNCLYRRAAGRQIGKQQVLVANVDYVWIVQAVRQPSFNLGTVDRLLVACEAQGLPAGLLINKTDLASPDLWSTIKKISAHYHQIGYQTLLTSVREKKNMELLHHGLSNKTSVLIGPSGTGKSSLLNEMDSNINIPVESISPKTNKGRHTTALATLHVLFGGGYVVDTPGIREFGLMDIEPWELAHYFPEFRPHLESCRYAACTHNHEPDCGIKDAREYNIISDTRYESYQNILQSLLIGERDTGR